MPFYALLDCEKCKRKNKTSSANKQNKSEQTSSCGFPKASSSELKSSKQTRKDWLGCSGYVRDFYYDLNEIVMEANYN